MSDQLVQGVIETIDATHGHKMELAELQGCLKEAKTQIHQSAEKSREKLNHYFRELRTAVNEALEERLQELLEQVSRIEDENMHPLQQCEDLIQQGVDRASAVLHEGKQLLMGNHEASKVDMLDFKQKSNALELRSLPEVPALSDVAYISVDLPEGSDLENSIRDLGHVMARAPVQLTEISERPGGLFIKWNECDEDYNLDLSEFWLQYCGGSVRTADDTSLVFHDAYKGPNKSHVVRHLKLMTPYSFRVCGRGEGSKVWSPWSVPATALTTTHHHEWHQTSGYTLSNENKTATRDCSEGGRVIFTSEPTYICGHSVVFKILESGDVDPGDGIAIASTNAGVQSLMGISSIFVTIEGKVYIDGREKLTKLPALRRGCVLVFDTEVLQTGKVRATIEAGDKIVTFDWTVEKEAPETPLGSLGGGQGVPAQASSTNGSITLYSAMKFSTEGWKVSVE